MTFMLTSPGAAPREADYFPTPGWCTHVLLDALPPPTGTVLEPSAGDGAIVRVLAPAGYPVSAVELREEERPSLLESGAARVTIADWLTEQRAPVPPYSIVTNPPFTLAREFAEKCCQSRAGYVALLLRINVLASGPWRFFWEAHRPTDMVLLTSRPSFTGDGKTDACNYAWVIWRQGAAPMSMHFRGKSIPPT